MLNSAPNNSKYSQGNFIPTNPDKVMKLNAKGGVYYRSSWEKKIMVWLDLNPQIVIWGAECLEIPYQMTNFENGTKSSISTHRYYPDFHYVIKKADGTTETVVAEVKPHKEYLEACKFINGDIKISEDLNLKKTRNLEYTLKTAYKNYQKWETMINWCDKKGFKFIIITEQTMKKHNQM